MLELQGALLFRTHPAWWFGKQPTLSSHGDDFTPFLVKLVPSPFDKFIEPNLLTWETVYVWRAL